MWLVEHFISLEWKYYIRVDTKVPKAICYINIDFDLKDLISSNLPSSNKTQITKITKEGIGMFQLLISGCQKLFPFLVLSLSLGWMFSRDLMLHYRLACWLGAGEVGWMNQDRLRSLSLSDSSGTTEKTSVSFWDNLWTQMWLSHRYQSPVLGRCSQDYRSNNVHIFDTRRCLRASDVIKLASIVCLWSKLDDLYGIKALSGSSMRPLPGCLCLAVAYLFIHGTPPIALRCSSNLLGK